MFDDKQSCLDFLKGEEVWTFVRTQTTRNGTKTICRCNMIKTRGEQCAAGIYTIHDKSPTDKTYQLYRKNCDHTHGSSANKVMAMAENVKQLIRDYVDEGLTTVSILHRLRAKNDIRQPERNQVNNYVKTYRKQIFGDSKVYLEDMIEYCEKYKLKENQDIDEPFVLAYEHSPLEAECDQSSEIEFDREADLQKDSYGDEIGEENAQGPWIRFIITTKRLLINSAASDVICADSTHKIVIQRYPIMVISTTDNDTQQHFHLLGMLISKFERSDNFEFAFRSLKNGIENAAHR